MCFRIISQINLYQRGISQITVFIFQNLLPLSPCVSDLLPILLCVFELSPHITVCLITKSPYCCIFLNYLPISPCLSELTPHIAVCFRTISHCHCFLTSFLSICISKLSAPITVCGEHVDNLVSGHLTSDGCTTILGIGVGWVDGRGDSVILDRVTGELGGELYVFVFWRVIQRTKFQFIKSNF